MESSKLCFAASAPCVGSLSRHVPVTEARPQARFANVSMSTATTTGVEAAKITLGQLLEANKRFANDAEAKKDPHPVSPAKLRNDLAVYGQKPVATIITCADSRVPPELFFRGTVGNLFVLRTAGNVTDDEAVLASIEYAVAVLKTPLVMVVGHELCGAVNASITYKMDDTYGSALPINLSKHVGKMAACLPEMVTLGDLDENQLLAACVESNAIDAARALPVRSQVVADAIKNREIMVAAAIYDISSGLVRVVEEHKLGDINYRSPETSSVGAFLSWLRR